ncbi:hypothetical protein [Paraburkholderia aromaticivorans]|uniref:hypothetical protein n=1 Tax=Paraburkholderia aromaticivorans TaxID=2026199 RepID=UPI0038B82B7B
METREDKQIAKLDNLHLFSKDEILATRKINCFGFYPENHFAEDDKRRRIDLGIHKYDIETMTYILAERMEKYYYILDLSIDNFVNYQPLACFMDINCFYLDGGPDWVGLETASLAIEKFGYGKELLVEFIRLQLKSPYLAIASNHFYIESLIEDTFEPFKHLGEEMLEPAKAVLRDPANRHFLPKFWGDDE